MPATLLCTRHRNGPAVCSVDFVLDADFLGSPVGTIVRVSMSNLCTFWGTWLQQFDIDYMERYNGAVLQCF